MDHGILLEKMAKASIRYDLALVIMKLITNRAYFVLDENKEIVSKVFADSGVPQGSFCGPFLFKFLCHDIHLQFANRLKLIQYADDIKLLMKIRTQADVAILQMEINNFYIWCAKNRFIINYDKTIQVTYGQNLIQGKYFLLDKIIKTRNGTKDLGVYFDKHLNFKEHIKQVSAKCYGLLSNMSRFCKLNKLTRIFNKMTNTFLFPIINYASEIWYSERTTIDLQIERLNKISTRISLNLPSDSRDAEYLTYNQRLIKLKELSYQDRLNVKSIVTLLKMRTGTLFYHDMNTLSNLESSTWEYARYLFSLPNQHTNYSLVFPIRKANQLRASITLNLNLHLNKTSLKRHYMQNYRMVQ